MDTYKAQLTADGTCGLYAEVQAESLAEAEQIIREHAAYIENWEVLSLNVQPDIIVVEVENENQTTDPS
jgi:hypothetical protein